MVSAAETFLDSGFAALLTVAGESLVFPDGTSVTAIVNRSLDRTVNGIPLETSIECPVASVLNVPSVAQTILDSLEIKHCIWRKRRINSNLVILCHTFADLPLESAILNGTSFSCFALDSTEGTDHSLGGFANEDTHRLAISRRQILSSFLPVEGQPALFRSGTYSVARVERNDAGACAIITIASRVSAQQS